MPTVKLRFDIGDVCFETDIVDLIRRSLRRGEGYGGAPPPSHADAAASLLSPFSSTIVSSGGNESMFMPRRSKFTMDVAGLYLKMGVVAFVARLLRRRHVGGGALPAEEFQEPTTEYEPAEVPAVASSASWLQGTIGDAEDVPAEESSYFLEGTSLNPSFWRSVLELVDEGMPDTVCLRPGFGDRGKQVMVKANHFLLTFGAVPADHLPMTRYDVTITPHAASKDLRRYLVLEVIKFESWCTRSRLAFDGWQSLYVAGFLPDVESYITYTHPLFQRESTKYKVSIRIGSILDLRELHQFTEGRQSNLPHEILHILDVVLRESPSNRYAVDGRSFFSPDYDGWLGSGLVYHKGFWQSLHSTQMGMSLNIDTVAQAFLRPGLLELFLRRLGVDMTRTLREHERVQLEQVLKGVTVEMRSEACGQGYKILGLTKESVQELMLPLDGTGTEIACVEYFKKEYHVTLHCFNFPAIKVCTDTKVILLPIEACRIPKGQRCIQKLDKNQAFQLFNATRNDPKERMIKETVATNYNEHGEGFGIQVRNQMACIEARVLPPPTIIYQGTGTNVAVIPSSGKWNMKDKKMIKGGSIEFWACINFSTKLDNSDVGKFCADLIDMCISKGMDCCRQPVVPIRFAHPNGIENALFRIEADTTSTFANLNVTGKRLQLLVVILHEKSDVYGKIKRICETELGIISQCFKPGSVAKTGEEYMELIENVSLKINAKVGGRNSLLKEPLILDRSYMGCFPTIIFGAAVTHPQPGDVSSISVAGIVATMDWPFMTKYHGSASSQSRGNEIINNLYTIEEDTENGVIHGGMIRELLSSFHFGSHHRPRRLIYYRDGVSGEQVNEVVVNEVEAIKKACESFYGDLRPKITCILVQKRHHTRLFPDGCNIPPGTVVDKEICHPTRYDFYLSSHAAGIQGISCPTHYHVLYDENRFSADGIQRITNDLCYTSVRCTRSVAVVPPVSYARLVARRARCYVEGHGATASCSGQVLSLPDNVKYSMFFI